MRLIDADEMNEELFYKQVGGKDTLISAECAFNMIKAQPTAYDVEKVVKQLKEHLLVVEIEDEHIIPESDVEEYFELEVVPMDMAIDIVRNAGKDGVV